MKIINILQEKTILPLKLVDLKLFLKVDYDDEDDIITNAFKSAIRQCEIKIGKTLIEKKYKYSFYNSVQNTIKLVYGPTINTESIKITDFENNEIEININSYIYDKIADVIIFKNKPQNFYRLDLIYTAGMENIPEDLMQGILNHTAKIFEDKNGYSSMPKASYNIYNKYKEIRL